MTIELTGADGFAAGSVTNAGPGIPAAAQDGVFERFYRADPAHGRRIDGVGLGLSLAAEIIRAHGGDLVLVGSADDATTFRARLPLA